MFQSQKGLELRMLPLQHYGMQNLVSFLKYNIHTKFQFPDILLFVICHHAVSIRWDHKQKFLICFEQLLF